MHEKGYLLIDAMIAMVVLVVGVLGLLSLQSRLLLDNQLAQYRTRASLLATQLVSAANSDTGNASCYVIPVGNQAGCASPTALAFTNNWLATVNAEMPFANLNPPTATLNVDGTMTINIFWRLNREAQFHRFVVRGQVQ